MAYVAGAPSTFINAILTEDTKDHLEGIDYSVTTLLSSPREVQLIKRHKKELPERNLSNRLATFVGSAIHNAIENSVKGHPDYLIEYRMEFDEEVNGKIVKIAGTCDMYDKVNKRLIDHKTTTTFMYNTELKPEWVEQLNTYAYLLRRQGFEVEKLTINCIYKDWRPSAGRYKEGEYPEYPVMEFNFDPWPNDVAKDFYERKLREHVQAEPIEDAELPTCDINHMWAKPSAYAVYRPGAAKAIRLLPSLKEAEQYIKNKRLDGCKIEHRVGERTKCEKYCQAAPFCNQFQKWKEEQNKELAEDILSGCSFS